MTRDSGPCVQFREAVVKPSGTVTGVRALEGYRCSVDNTLFVINATPARLTSGSSPPPPHPLWLTTVIEWTYSGYVLDSPARRMPAAGFTYVSSLAYLLCSVTAMSRSRTLSTRLICPHCQLRILFSSLPTIAHQIQKAHIWRIKYLEYCQRYYITTI